MIDVIGKDKVLLMVLFLLVLGTTVPESVSGTSTGEGETTSTEGEVRVVTRSWTTMGTYAGVTLITDRSEEEIETGVQAVRDAFDRIDRTMSVYSPESDVTRLNRWAGINGVIVDPWLVRLLDDAREAFRVTRGAFSVLQLGAGVELGLKPNLTGRPLARRPLCTDSMLQVSSVLNRAWIPCPATGVDPGGVAKGFALDRAAERLREHGFDRFMVDLGRSLMAGDPPPGEPGWPVQLEGNGRMIRLRNSALSVSQQGIQSDTGHIVNPATGDPVRGRRWVGVEAGEGWISDMASTALMVNPQIRDRIREAYPGVGRIWILDPGDPGVSSARLLRPPHLKQTHAAHPEGGGRDGQPGSPE